jgi:excinuclease ABC subunit B
MYNSRMAEFKLKAKFKPSGDQDQAINTLTQNVKDGMDRQMMLGVTGSGKTFVMANMIEKLQKPTLILSHNKTLAAQLYEEFKEFFPDNAVKYFVSYYDYYQPEAYIPGRDIYIEKESDVNKEIERFRLSAMNSALTRNDLIVVASVSCIYNIGNPKDYKERSFELNIGDSIALSELSRRLVQMQYQRDLTDFVHGSFRVKGDVVDVYMPYAENPIRLDFFGDELEKISYIDALTGYPLSSLESIEIFPSKAFTFDADQIKRATDEIEYDLKLRLKEYRDAGRELEAQRLEGRTNYDLEMLAQVGYCKGMENYSRYFEDRGPGEPPYTLMDYFPKDSLLFVDESHITIPQVGGMSGGDRARKQTLIDYGFRLPSARDNRPLNFDEFRERQRKTVYFSATPKEWEIEDSNNTVIELLTRPTGLLDPQIEVRPTQHQIDDVMEEVKKNTAKGERILITTLTKRMAEDLSSYLDENGIKVHYLHSDQDTVERVDVLRSLRLGEFDVVVGINLLREGLDLPEVSLILILDADKEGFLRSKTSLVQTVGRAARHVNGRVIMYADKITESMKYTIDETKRRRKLQMEHNKIHGITPTSITKDIRDQLVKKEDETEIEYKKWIEKTQPPKAEIKRVIRDLNDKMLLASENLQFEKAAELRDKIKDLKESL